MVKLLWLGAATAGVLALAGVPAPATLADAVGDTARQTVSVLMSMDDGSGPVTASGWSEAGSLMLVAAAFFGAAALVGRRPRRKSADARRAAGPFPRTGVPRSNISQPLG